MDVRPLVVCGWTVSLLYQEARGVVQETTEATDKAPLQEGRVLRRNVLRVVAHYVAGDVTAVVRLQAYSTHSYGTVTVYLYIFYILVIY